MLLRLLINALLAFALFRLLRRLFAPRSEGPRVSGQPRPRRLDPDQAVRATWKEIPDEGGTRPD
jgi:hypothetical protein